jgi:GntR family transcriptional regulator
MKLWISKHSEVPVSEQLTTQIVLAINSGELKPNQKLPSTRELARRFSLHSNTVNAAYRNLARRGWLYFRKGSGVYARGLSPDISLEGRLQLDQLISAFIRMARQQGFALAEIRSRVKVWLDFQPPDRFLVIEPDPELRRILLAEIHSATGFPVQGAGPEACQDPGVLTGAAVVAMYGRGDELRESLPAGVSCLILRSRSAAELDKIPVDATSSQGVAIVSRWPDFLRWARAILLARGMQAAQLSLCDAREKHWQKALRSCIAVTDVVTAAQMPPGGRTLLLHLIAESSLQELRDFVDQFLGSSGDPRSKTSRRQPLRVRSARECI